MSIEEEEDLCRVCRSDADDGNPLIYPCKCAGSMRYVHSDCLQEWLSHSRQRHCEICGHAYTFTKVYPASLPSAIPAIVYVRQSIFISGRFVWRILRACIAIISWLVILPIVTMLTLRTIMAAVDFATSPAVSYGLRTVIEDSHQELNATIEFNSTTANLTGRDRVIALVAANETYSDIMPSLISNFNGDFNNFIAFVFRGQIVAISVAAGLIGLILIREWIGQLDWHPRPVIEEEGELRPEEWVFRNGRAIRKTEYEPVRPRRKQRSAGTGTPREEGAGEEANGVNVVNGRDAPPHIEIRPPTMDFGGEDYPPPRPSPSHVAFAAPEQLGEAPFWDFVRESDKGKEPVRPDEKAGTEGTEAEAEAEAGPSRPAADVPDDVSGNTTPANKEKDIPWRLQDALLNPASNSDRSTPLTRPGYESPHGTAYPQSPPNEAVESSSPSPLATSFSAAAREAQPHHPPLEEHGSLETVHSTGSGPDQSPDFRRASDPGPPANESPRPPQRPYGSTQDFPVEIIFESPPQTPPEQHDSLEDAGMPSNSTFGEEHFVESPAPATPTIVETPADDESPEVRPVLQPQEETQPELADDADADLDEWTDAGEAEAGDVEGEDADNVLDDGMDDNGHDRRIRDLILARDAMNPVAARERLAEIADLRAEMDMMVEPLAEDEDDRPLDADDWDGILEVIGFIGPLTGLFHNHVFVSIAMSCTLTFLVGLPVALGKMFLAIDPIRGTRDLTMLVLHSVVFVADGLLSLVLTIARQTLNIPRLLARPAAGILGSFGVQFNLTDPTINLPTHFMIKPWDANMTIIPDIPVMDSTAGRVLDGLELLGSRSYDAYKLVRLQFVSIAASSAVMDQFWCLTTGYALCTLFLVFIAILDAAHLLNVHTAIMERARDVQVFLKVLFFMTLEMVMFPLFVGVVIDLCTMPLFGATVASRLAHYGHRTFGSLFIAWLIGSIFMFSFAAFLTHMRTICRSGALYFIRDPSDPAHSPVRDIMERPALVQLPRLAVSAVMYCVIVFTIFGTMPYFMWALGATTSLFKGVLPLRLEQRPLSSVPFDLLFLHLIVPPSWEGLKVYSHMIHGLASWWLFVVRQLELSSLVFGVEINTRPMSRVSQLVWIVADAFCQRIFGAYDNRATPARVPNSDRIELLSLSERRKEGMFILLDSNGAPRSPADEMRLLKQDRAARRAGRNPKRDYTVVNLPEYWRTRVYALFASAMLSAAALIATVVLVPLCVGRLATNMVFHEHIYDGYNWIVGGYICWGSYALGKDLQRRIITYSRARRIRKSGTSTRAKRVVLARLSNAYALALLYFAFPMLVGINFELFIGVPARYGLAKGVTPVLHLWDAWAMGVAFTSIYVGALGFANEGQELPLGQRFRHAFKHPLHQPFRQLNEFILPILAGMLLPIMVPWVVFYGIRSTLLALGLSGVIDGTAAFRLTYPLLFVPCTLYFLRGSLTSLLGKMRQWMIDAEYVVYERVENYEPEADDGASDWEDVDGGEPPGGNIGIGNGEEEGRRRLDPFEDILRAGANEIDLGLE